MPTYTRFLPDARRADIIAYLVAQEPPADRAAASLDWQGTDDEALLESYNYARRQNGLPALVAPAPDPREREA